MKRELPCCKHVGARRWNLEAIHQVLVQLPVAHEGVHRVDRAQHTREQLQAPGRLLGRKARHRGPSIPAPEPVCSGVDIDRGGVGAKELEGVAGRAVLELS